MQPAASTDPDVGEPRDTIRLAMGDLARSLCSLLDVSVPENVISIHLSADGLKIEYSDTLPPSGRYVVRTVQHRGPVQFRPLDSAPTL